MHPTAARTFHFYYFHFELAFVFVLVAKESSDLAVTTSAEEISIFGITTLHSWPNLNYQQFEESTGISTSKAHTVKSG